MCNEIYHCSVCGEKIKEELFDGRSLLNHVVYDIDGFLDSILLAHTQCGIIDNIGREVPFWNTETPYDQASLE